MEVFRGTIFRSSREVLISTLTTARTRALANMHGSSHGVCYDAPDMIIFRGDSYAPSESTNERVVGNPSFSISSEDDFFSCETGSGIVFEALTGNTTNEGDITISSTGHADETVRVNEAGTIVW